MFAGRCRPLRAPHSAAMGEMQGALARARLESLLRPRHKKRAEAQKRSESVLLSGLGKHRRPARGGLGSGGVWVGRGRMETGGWRRTEPGGCAPGTGVGRPRRWGRKVGAEPCAAGLPTRANGKSPGRSTPPVPSFCPGGRRTSASLRAGILGVLVVQPAAPSAPPGRPARLTQDQAASHPHPPGSRSAAGAAAGAGPRGGRGSGRRFLIVPPAPPPRRRRVYKGGREAGAHCWLSRFHRFGLTPYSSAR